jgi:hypothetical protein
MPSSGAEGGAYEVRESALIAQAFRRLQRQATREGRGKEFLRAASEVFECLQRAPLQFGEPLYYLPNLRLQVRCVSIRPLYVDFAVCEDRPIVFIKAVKLFSPQDS